MTPQPFVYRVIVMEVYDGDTFRADFDLGMGVWVRDQRVRLARVNAPELRDTTGVSWREWLSNRLCMVDSSNVVVQTIKDRKEKYGRWLGEVWVGGQNVNDELRAAIAKATGGIDG